MTSSYDAGARLSPPRRHGSDRARSRSAARKTPKGNSPAARSMPAPATTRAPSCRACWANSASRRVLPTPASPVTATQLGRLPVAATRPSSRSDSSSARPTNGGRARPLMRASVTPCAVAAQQLTPYGAAIRAIRTTDLLVQGGCWRRTVVTTPWTRRADDGRAERSGVVQPSSRPCQWAEPGPCRLSRRTPAVAPPDRPLCPAGEPSDGCGGHASPPPSRRRGRRVR